MMLSLKSPVTVLAGAALLIGAGPARKPRPDLADMVQGSYSGDVVSDARGSARTGVGVELTKAGPSRVTIVFDYARMPSRTFRLTRVADTIQNVGGTEVFLLELAKSPRRLSLTIDDAVWSGTRDN
jgi:hypothetical protein